MFGTSAPQPDRTLAAIDEVLNDWRGSEDAMVWTAEEPNAVQSPACRCADPDDVCDICVPCDVCRSGARECGCDGEYTDCRCDGSGYAIPDHCCGCGGSPYCVRCHACGASCFGDCTCPVTVALEGGATLTL